MNHKIGADSKVGGQAMAGSNSHQGIQLKNTYRFEAYAKPRLLDYVVQCFGLFGPVRGRLKWADEVSNIVPNGGLDDLLDKYLKGSAYTAAFFVGLTDGTPTTAAGDTMASHAGWAEVTAFTESVRQALTLGSVSGQSVDNSASKATFSINADSTTIGGAFVATNNTKGGTAGVLYSVAAFNAGDKALDNGDTLNVTVTLTAASA